MNLVQLVHDEDCLANGLGMHEAGAPDQACTWLAGRLAARGVRVGREDEAYAAGHLAGYEDGVTDTENRLAAAFYEYADRADQNKGDEKIALVAKVWRQAAAVVYAGKHAEVPPVR